MWTQLVSQHPKRQLLKPDELLTSDILQTTAKQYASAVGKFEVWLGFRDASLEGLALCLP